MVWADEVRQGDRDGGAHLSLRGMELFATWFLQVCLDQLSFTSDIFARETLSRRLTRHVDRSETIAPESKRQLHEARSRGEFDRGEVARITQVLERSAGRVLKQLTDERLLAFTTPKGGGALHSPSDTLEMLLPRLYA